MLTRGEKILLLFLVGGALAGFAVKKIVKIEEPAKIISVEKPVPKFESRADSEVVPQKIIAPFEKKTLKRVDVKIDINASGVDELMRLPGIGKAIAERIVKYREQNGPFLTNEALLSVKGIGQAKLEKIAPQIVLR
jgi:competence ComEA-like helix-hairpin-helix protein